MKVYWNTATLIHLAIVYVSFPAPALSAELSSFSRNQMQSLKYLLCGPLE